MTCSICLDFLDGATVSVMSCHAVMCKCVGTLLVLVQIKCVQILNYSKLNMFPQNCIYLVLIHFLNAMSID